MSTKSMKELRFGIEIETVKRTRKEVAQAVQKVVGGSIAGSGYETWKVNDSQGRTWKVVNDSSLSDVPSDRRAEVVSPILTYNDIPQLQEVVRSLRKAKAYASKKCGIHIHVEAEPFNGRTLGNLAKMVYKQEDLIVKALNVSSTRLNKYTKKTEQSFISKIEKEKPQTKDHLNRLWYGQAHTNESPSHYNSTRYHGLNLHNVWYRGTVEFRYFEGTLHAGKVKAYIQFCLALCEKALKSKSASSRKREANGTSDKYDFRCFLLTLGLIGEEFKTARKHLLDNLNGSTAWKNGRPAANNNVNERVLACA